MNQLERITTEYVECEDRIRVSGAFAHGDTVVLWLTQRLLQRLVPHLTGWLSRRVEPVSGIAAVQATHEDLVQGFAQQAARAQLVPEPPVRAPSLVVGERVDAVDIAQGEDVVVLTFKSAAGVQAVLPLAAQPLRQWLGIIYEQCVRGQWPTTVWPAWIQTAAPAQTVPGPTVLH